MNIRIIYQLFLETYSHNIRNEVVHGSNASKYDAIALRNKILGVACDSILTDILKNKKIVIKSKES
ncbi:hypothetical protein FE243_03570 [Aliarcobacter thereius]|uniref:hypothetical protein n=1 Tax=Aliarcobacter thereius TaxID=544718 RepID=UPI0010FE3006|nr:hypothetical protein [Aliarcobacter thereius]TLT07826.1 hypothetical protein FE243_03570 [Aliarcobacter thereius]